VYSRTRTCSRVCLKSIPSEIPVSADGDVNETRDKAPPNVPAPPKCAQEVPDIAGSRIGRVHRVKPDCPTEIGRIQTPRHDSRETRQRERERVRRGEEERREMLTGSVPWAQSTGKSGIMPARNDIPVGPRDGAERRYASASARATRSLMCILIRSM